MKGKSNTVILNETRSCELNVSICVLEKIAHLLDLERELNRKWNVGKIMCPVSLGTNIFSGDYCKLEIY